MRFMILGKSGPNTESEKLPPDPAAAWQAMEQFNEALQKAGAWVAGEGLKASKHGVRLAQTNGDRSRVDGPFAEAREVIAGYAVIDVPSLSDAIAWVKQTPYEACGPLEDVLETEIRPFFTFPGQPESPWATFPPPAEGLRRYCCWVGADAASERGELGDPQLFVDMEKLVTNVIQRGRWGGGDGLAPTSKGAKVVFTPGKREVIDGPFAEAKELVAGFAIIYAKDLEEAVEFGWEFLAVDAPGRGGHSKVEIRPIFDAADFA